MVHRMTSRMGQIQATVTLLLLLMSSMISVHHIEDQRSEILDDHPNVETTWDGIRGELGFSALFVGNTVIDLGWGEYVGDFGRYEVHRDGGLVHTESDRTEVWFRNEGLSKGTEFEFELKVFDSSNSEVQNETLTVTTGEVRGTIMWDLTWGGTSSPYNLSDGVEVIDGATITIERGVIVNCSGHSIGVLERDSRASIDGVTFLGGGISFEGVTEGSVVNSTFDGSSSVNAGFGVSIKDSDHCLVKNNSIISYQGGTGRGIILWNTTDSRIEENTISSCPSGVSIYWGSHRNLVHENRISNCDRGIWVYKGSDHNTVSRNTCTSMTNASIEIMNSIRTNLTGNTVEGSDGTGITLSGSPDTTVNESTVSHCPVGISISGSRRGKLNRNTIQENGNGIIMSGSAYSVINRTSLMNQTDTGITVKTSEKTELNRIIGNNNTNNAIFIQNSANCTIRASLFNNRSGITIDQSRNCIVNGTRLINGSDLVIYSSDEFNSTQNIFDQESEIRILQSDLCLVDENIIGNSSNVGIDISQVTNSVIRRNTIRNCSSGITIRDESTGNRCTANTALSNLEQGIWIQNSNRNLVEANTLLMNTWFGAKIDYNSSFNTISNNRITDNGDDVNFGGGIGLYSADNNSIEDNEILRNHNNGIDIRQGSHDNNITGNNISNHNTGLHMETYSIANHRNLIYNNYFDNTQNVFDQWGYNRWNISKTPGQNVIRGAFLGGNFWSNYTGEDTNADGLGDTLVHFNENKHIVYGGDYLPLVRTAVNPVWNLDTNEGFAGIQAAIDDEDTLNTHRISVNHGTFHENVKVTKKVTINGVTDPIVIADDRNDHTFEVTVDHVTISGLTIRGATGNEKAGILVRGAASHNCTIRENHVSGNYHGINLSSTRDTTIFENDITDNEKDGVRISASILNSLQKNDITQNRQHGVNLINSAHNNTIGGELRTTGNLISGNTNSGISIRGGASDTNVITGNLIGTNPAGNGPNSNENGVVISEGASQTMVGGVDLSHRNVISGNSGYGIEISREGSDSNRISMNYIGTDIDGGIAIENSGGVSIFGGVYNSSVGPGNVISGNGASGVRIEDARTQVNHIFGNVIGLNHEGLSQIPNLNGIVISGGANFNTIGGTTDERNIISGNYFDGILIQGSNTYDNTIASNFIGTDITGLNGGVPNYCGVEITDSSSSNIIGLRWDPITEDYLPAGNVISGNSGPGIKIIGGSQSNKVMANFIGTDKHGTGAIPNDDGVIIWGDSESNVIGAEGAFRNVISGNQEIGVGIYGSGNELNEVAHNYIGVDVTGLRALPNEVGIRFAGAKYCDIDSNVISGNRETGINCTGGDFIEIIKNFIGTDKDGNAAVPNRVGISIYQSDTTIVGYRTQERRNVISGNDVGIGLFLAETAVVAYNLIGRNRENTTSIPNRIAIDIAYSRGCLFKSNTISSNCRGFSFAVCLLNAVIDNSILHGTCGETGIHLNNSSPTIIGNTIAYDQGDAITCENGSNPIIHYNTFFENTGSDINNLDPSVTIDARYNYWGDPDSADPAGEASIKGNVDVSIPLQSGEVSSDSIELNGTNSTYPFDGRLEIGYASADPSLLTVVMLDEPPGPPPEKHAGPFFVLLLNRTEALEEMSIELRFTREDIETALGEDWNNLTLVWKNGDRWSSFSNRLYVDVDNWQASRIITWTVFIRNDSRPGPADLDELVFGLGIPDEIVEDDDDGFPIWTAIIAILMIIAMAAIGYYLMTENRGAGSRNETSSIEIGDKEPEKDRTKADEQGQNSDSSDVEEDDKDQTERSQHNNDKDQTQGEAR